MIRETCVFCDREIPGKHPTNADCIRGMTDEELAVTLACPNEIGLAEIPCGRSDNNDCYQCLLGWLQQPAETEG